MPDTPTHLAYLSLGANIGDRLHTIARAAKLIAATPGVRLVKMSSMYATDPVGYLDQPEFINSAAIIETTMEPQELLGRLRAIERTLGRVRRVKWHEREIDIDIVLMDDLVVQTDELTIPHPEMHRRRFVLQPLAEIAPDVVHPLLGVTIRELLDACPDDAGVHRIEGV
jgi:2-amino-4-hydroxy-6-hydroxymethyldihydropteridine diphosphokinase